MVKYKPLDQKKYKISDINVMPVNQTSDMHTQYPYCKHLNKELAG